MLIGQTEGLDQIPCKPGFGVKITEYLESSIAVIDNFIQSRRVLPSGFVVLATSSQLNLAVFSNKLYRTRTVVPDARGLTYFIAGSSIETWIVLAAAIGARDVIIT